MINLIVAFSVIVAGLWLRQHYTPFMEYATKHPSNTAFLEYFGYRKRKEDEEK